MSIIVGSARADERGKISGGTAGDQTGREVSTQSYYKHSKGWHVLRAKDPEKGNKIAKAMKAACDNRHIGYDQMNRNTLYNAVKDKGFNPAKATSNVETDCSALVRVCVNYAGIKVGDMNTSSLRSTLLATGQFEDVTSKVNTSSGSGLCNGDVLVTKTKGHTVVVVSGNPRIVGKAATVKTEAAKTVSSTTKTAAAKATVHLTGVNAKVKAFQNAFNVSYGGNLVVDGKLGPKTKAAFTKVLLTTSTKNKATIVKFVQGVVGVTADGSFGSKTKEAVKKWQKAHGLSADGQVGPKTIAKMVA